MWPLSFRQSSTRTNTMVNIKTETDNGNLEVLQQSQMQEEAMSSQSSCQTKSSLAVHLRPCKKSKGLGKRVKLEDNQGATELSKPPINLFEDECVFCHSFRTIEEFHGPMVRYLEGRIVSSDEGNLTNAIYVHKKCMDWAPRVFFDGKRFVNMEKEISRASRLKCSKCRLPGAALGCYHHPCANTYHVPCALMIRECAWDDENRNVWCPKHASNQLPCDEMSSPIMESDINSPIVQNQYLVQQGMSIIHRCEDQQVYQQNTSSSSLSQGQCSDKEGICADYRREENQTNQTGTPVAVGRVHQSVMSFCEKLPPPPGFGAAAASRRPPRMDFGGSKSATRTNTMVNIKTETDNGNLEVLQQSQMQKEAMANQSSCQTKSSLAGGPYTRSLVDATKVASPGVNASNTGQHLRPCNKSKGLGKLGKLEDNQGATELSRPPTPISLFEDECVFCHSFRTTEKFYGPMVRYREGRIVSSDEGNLTNAIYVHKNCMVWAPKVYLDGDTYIDVEKEIGRASRLKCMMILDRWDVKNLHVLCPKHASDTFPCDEMRSPMMDSATLCPILQNQYLDKQGMSVIHGRKDQQVDQPNTLSSSSQPQGQFSDKEGNSADYRREENQTNHSITPVDKWVLLGSVLSASEKDSLKEFASLTSSTLAEEWDKNVTHVIVGRSAGSTCGRSYEVLMAILSGKWVVTAGWIVDCLAELIPGPKICLAEPITVPEISYEVEFLDGPKKGRDGAAEVAPKLFSGLYFCLSAYLNPEYRENIQALIAAAEGQVLEGSILTSLQENSGKTPANVYFIYYEGPPRDYAATLFVGKEFEEAMKYASLGAQVISHLRVFHAIASYDALVLERSYHFTPDTYEA
ncbi:unnamed protein product [Alopecurus aequalis]